MSVRQNKSRFVASIFVIALVSILTFASIGGKLTGLLTATSMAAESVHVEPTTAQPLVIGTCDTAGPVEIESTGGTTSPTAYANLGAAFTAINAGTHTGAINVEICASTSEGTTPATLNSNGAGSAAYTTVLINPIADGLTISGNPVTGFGVIQLNGADGVTINGDNPNTAGTNRNLTVSNTTTNTVIANSAIRVATSAAVTSADNISIKNLILLGNVTGGNASTITSTTGSSNSSFGIYVGGNGGATATGAPTAITSVTTNTAPSGTTINNLVIDNNVVNQAARAIVFNGAAASVSSGINISNNIIGDQGATTPATPPYTAPATTVYTKGIWVAGTTAVTVSGNTIKNLLSYVGTTMTAIEMVSPVTSSTITGNTVNTIANSGTVSVAKAILVSSNTGAYSIADNTVTNVQALASASGTDGIEVTAAATGGTIERNKVQTVYNRSTGTFGAYGINLTAGTGIVIRNNFVSDINMDMTGGGAFSTQFGVHGLRITGGTNHKVYHNTIHLTGSLLGVATTSILTSAFTPSVSTITGMDVRNNIFSNTMTGGTTSIAHVSMFLPAAATSAMNLTLNNNDYFSGPDSSRQGIAQVGTTAGTGFFLASGFNAGSTTPATNLRSYTSTLSAAGTNDNASKVVDPLLISNTDLHIQSISTMESAGVEVGVPTDIDGQTRPNGPVPDIGADEIAPPALPGTLQFNNATYSGPEGNTATITVSRTGGSLGSVSVDYATIAGGTATGGGSCGGSVDYVNASGTLTFGDGVSSRTFTVQLCSDAATEGTETVNLQLSNATGGATVGAQSTATLSIIDVVTFNGSVNVGTGQTFTSLTNPGGIFEFLNNGVVTGNVTLNLTSDLTAETGAVALNQIAGGFSLTIQPSGGAARVISGGGPNALLDFNGADGVTIDGLNTGGNSLTIRSTTVGSAVRFINDASNNTVTRTTLEANANSSVISISTGASTGNDNNSIVGNTITGRSDAAGASFNSINLIGTSAAISNSNTVINNNTIVNFLQAGIVVGTSDNVTFTNNDISQTVSRTTSLFGIAINSMAGTNAISGNSVHDLTTTLSVTGLAFNDARDTTVARNRVFNIPSTTGSTGTLTGILSNGSSGNPASLTIVNNSISIIPAFTNAQNIFGIRDFGFATNTFSSYYNTVLIGGTGSGATNTWACQRGFSAPTNYTMIDNLCFNNRTGGTGNHFSTGDQSQGTGTFVSNNNIFVGTGATAANHFDKSTSSTSVPVDFASWQAGTPARDASSQASNPGVGNYTVANMFVSTTNLHLANEGTNPASNAGAPVAGITTDFDGNTRSATTPEIGFDEFFVAVPGTLAFSSATYSVSEAGPTVTLTVNRTGGSDGSVQVDYTLSGGTATGGGACGGSVDYVSVSTSLVFAAGETFKTFTVPICNDSVFEGDETFNATLSNATGGATIGSPNPAVVTITDNKSQPTVQFSSATYSTVDELGGGGLINVTLSGASQTNVTVNYATVAGGTATGGASCTAGVDYINTSGTLTFLPGQVSLFFSVPTCLDSVDEPDETVNLALTSPVGAALGVPNTAVLTLIDNDAPSAAVTVTATAGTPGPTPYSTLKEAIDAINAGTHQGAVTVNLNSNTVETATSVLNSSGAGTASYTSVLIRPTADNVTVAGPSLQGFGLIELNGADNVTIDGDNPGTAGTNRNLTIQNTAANTVTFTSVIRVALAATVVNSADNDVFKNLNIIGSSPGRNIAAATTTTGTENTTFGILAGTGASTTTATTAPVAIASVSTGVAAGATANNLSISNNNIVTAARAISINGTATSVFPGLAINGNTIGNPVAGNVDQVTAIGITASGSTNAVVAGNTVYVEGFIGSSASTHAISIGLNSTAISGTTIERNRINRVKNNNGQSWAAYGINLGGGNSHIVRNNFVSGVINDQTAGTGAFGTTFGAYGIRVGTGTGHQIYHNSVHLYGPLGGVVSTDLTAAFMIVATTQTGVDVRNNIFSNQIAGGNPTGTRNVAVFLPSGATAAMNLTINNNAYYQGSDALSRMAQVGTTFGTGEYLADNFDPTSTTPASNFRAYTSTLSAAGTNDNASFATTTPPPFTSNTDLHIPAGTATRLESGGVAVGVTTDIDAETRNATTPDIGADEFAGAPAPANDIAASAFVVPANGSTIPTGSFTPQARFANNGTAAQTNVPVRFRIFDSSMTEIYNQTATIPTINPLQIVTVSFPSTSIAVAGNFTMQAAAENPGDVNAANNIINGAFSTVVAVSGTVSVGTGQTYTSLTNPGGLFAQLNLAGISGNITVNITSDLAGETGAVALNQIAESGAGGYTVTIKPSGAARTISGTSAVNNGIINLNGADRIVFDGSLSGGTDRSLTITNAQTGTSTVFWVKSANASNGANNNTIKNMIINGTSTAAAQTTAGILAGSGVTIGGAAEAPNNNNTVNNNRISNVQNSIYDQGNVGFDQGWAITNNEFGSTVEAEKNKFRGMLMGNANNFVISGNTVLGVTNFAATTGANTGIQLAFGITNGTIVNNKISNVHNLSATGTGAFGMQLGATPTTNIVVANNFIWDIQANGSATVASNGHGITVNAAATAGGYKIYHNSINMNTDQVTAGTSAALNITSAVVAAGALDVRNNVFSNTQTTGTRYAVYSAAAASVFGTINYNDYFAQNVGFLGSTRTTLADWQTATGQDANSKAVDPLFVSATNLHIQNASPMANMGVTGTGITTDIDGQTRDATPDIGADELVGVVSPGSLQFSSATYTVGEAGPVATITVTRTGGTDGTVTAQYATSNGTATGGASCGAGVDYVNTSGTVTFVNGDASETFDVPICNDAAAEGNETFNVTLSGPGGGAVIGTPSTAVVTITDDDVVGGTFAINDVRLFEGNSGARNFVFTVSYSGPAVPVSVQYATANGTAIAGVDYLATSGTLNFTSPGSQTVTVVVISDTLKEANETFFVNLSSPTGATIADGQGVGIIIDEDRPYVADFDLDRVADFSVFRASEGRWYVLRSASASLDIVSFGTTGDIAVPGDYDGDGITDYALWRPSTGQWFRTLSSNGSQTVSTWGTNGDKPVQGDYDGDGKTDLAVFRPSTGTWWILRSSNGASSAVAFGINSDRPVQGDYDGDAKTDIAVYRDGTWYISRSSDGAVQIANFGLASDKPVSGDFDGDGKFDLAIYRGGVWWSFSSLTGTAVAVPWGNATDIPVPADYDGDGTTDRAVFRPSSGDWYVIRSSNSTSFAIHWGLNGDVPIPAAYLPQ